MDNEKDRVGSIPDEVDGMSDRQIALKTYKKVCSVETRVEHIDERVENLDDRVESAEQVTVPINDIGSRAWDHVKMALSYAVIGFFALIGLGMVWVFAQAKGIWNAIVKILPKVGG